MDLTSTWVEDKVTLEVEQCWRVLKTNEFYNYEVTQYDPKTGEGVHLFQYIDVFLRLKAEASCYSGWVLGPKDEDTYVQYV